MGNGGFIFDADRTKEPKYLVYNWDSAVYYLNYNLREDWRRYSSYKKWMQMIFGEDEVVARGVSASEFWVRMETFMHGEIGKERPYQMEIFK